MYSNGSLADAWFGKDLKIGFAKKSQEPSGTSNNYWVEGRITNIKESGGSKETESIPMFAGAFKSYQKPQEDFEIAMDCILTDTYFEEILFGGAGSYIDSFDNYADNTALQAAWTETGDGANPTLDTTNFKSGAQAMTLTWTFTGGTATYTFDISTTQGQTFDISGFTGASGAPTRGRISMLVYVPNSTVLAAIGAAGIEFRLGSSSANYKGWTYAKSKLTTGWNLVVFNMATTPATTAGTADWTLVDYVAIILTEGVTDATGITIDEIRVYDPVISSAQENSEWRVTLLWEANTSTIVGEKLRWVYKNARAISWEPEHDAEEYLKGALTFKLPSKDSSGAANLKKEYTPDAATAALTALDSY